MNTEKITTDLSDIFNQNAIDVLFGVNHSELLSTVNMFYDDIFVYGTSDKVGDYNSLDQFKRANIAKLYRTIIDVIQLSSIYIESDTVKLSIQENLNDIIKNSEYSILDLFEEMMMISVYGKWTEIGKPSIKYESINQVNYKNYILIKTVLKGYIGNNVSTK